MAHYRVTVTAGYGSRVCLSLLGSIVRVTVKFQG